MQILKCFNAASYYRREGKGHYGGCSSNIEKVGKRYNPQKIKVKNFHKIEFHELFFQLGKKGGKRRKKKATAAALAKMPVKF